MRKIIIKFLKYLLNTFDKDFKDYYNINNTGNNQENSENVIVDNNVKEIIKDGLEYNGEFSINDFYNMYGYQALKGMYNIINEYYISELAKYIHEGNEVEIAKLKHIQIILNDFKSILKRDE